MMSHVFRLLAVLGLLMAFAVVAPRAARAATIAVGLNGCTLADAIRAANTDTATGGCPAGSGADTIVLEAGATYTLSAVDNTNNFYGATGLPVVTSAITIQGNGATIQHGAGAPDFRLLRQFGGSLTLQNLTLRDGRAIGTIGLRGWGGCLLASSGGTLTITGSTMAGCVASSAPNGAGAALASMGQATAISGSTFTGNSGHEIVRIASASEFPFPTASATITNSTISDNTSLFGAVISNTGSTTGSTLALTNVTIVASGSVQAFLNGAASAQSSILIPAPTTLDGGTFTDLGGNLTSGDPLLAPLADNGGPTQTRLPGPGSPAIDGAGVAPCPTSADQRGMTRPQGLACDIGAVEVTATTPALTLPANQTVEATGPDGADFTYEATAADYAGRALSVTCEPPSGSTFPLGMTTVHCSASDVLGQTTTASFAVTVADTTAPSITVPADMTVEATGPSGALVTYAAGATDLVDPAPTFGCAPLSGATFQLGETTVTCTATDTAGNTASDSFTVTVQDTTPPTVDAQTNVTAEATGPGGAVVTYQPPASHDDVAGDGVASCTPPSGSAFALGPTTVQCSATDAATNTGSGSFVVTVVDTTAPILSVPVAIAVDATSPSGAVVSYSASATDVVDGVVMVTCTPASGAIVPIGPTTVTCTATDAAGNTATATFRVVVGKPQIASLSPNRVKFGSPTTTVTVRGGGFVDGAVVTVGGQARQTTFVSSGELRVIVPASDLSGRLWWLGPLLPIKAINPGNVASNTVYLALTR